jgi:hypothetical protein
LKNRTFYKCICPLKSNGTNVAFDAEIIYVYQQLMKRKIYILTILSIFFVATTGLPLAIHMCSMKGMSPTSTCKMHNMMKEEHNCCNNKEDENPVKISLNDFNACCQFKVFNKNITDQFLSSGNDLSVISNFKIINAGIFTDYQTPDVTVQFNYTSSSPPTLLDNHIYLDNSVFLI